MATPDPGSPILTAMYRNGREEARRMASAAPTLTVWEASALGADDRLGELLDREPALVNAVAPDGHTPLGLAAFFAPAATTRLLLEHGADVSVASRNDMTVQPLHAAVAGRNAEALALLLERGADPDARQQVGYTPLMGAAAAGRGDMVDLLLRRGADAALTNDHGKNAADLAREHGHPDVADRLDAGAARFDASGRVAAKPGVARAFTKASEE